MTDLQIQLLLAYLGYDPGTLDGIMGKNTRAAVTAFQTAEGLTADGIPGTQTQARLREAVFQGRQRQEDTPAAVEEKSGDWWDEIKYFSRNDPYIACSCGKCGGFPAEPAEKLMRLADKVRGAAGKPMIPTSTVRCKTHNAEVGGVPTSRHLIGHAMDFRIQGMSADQILAIVRTQPEVVYCYAINDRCVHMDIGK